MKRDPSKFWIVKPAASSQGRGIYLTNSLAEIPHKEKQHVVSEYISNPLLINGFKFDLRIYVAITSVSPLRFYIYEEGLARFATSKYLETSGTNDKFKHLTNFSVNKKNANFVNSDGQDGGASSKWSLSALRTELRQKGIDDAEIWRKIEDIVTKTVISAEPYMFQTSQASVPFRDSCFELLGFDILIDSQLEPWLIEVNLSCSLGCNSALDLRVKSNLVADLFTLIGMRPLHKRKKHDAVKNVSSSQQFHHNPQMSMYTKKSQQELTGLAAVGKKQQSVPAGGNSSPKAQNKPKFKEEAQIVKETEMEFRRRQGFKRLFPSVNYAHYRKFFIC